MSTPASSSDRETSADLLVVRVPTGLASDLDRVLDTLGEACGRDRRFAIAFVLENEAGAAGGGGARGRVAQMRRFKSLRRGLAQRCAGVAFVLDGEAQQVSAKRLRSAPRMFGCPVQSFVELTAARAWLEQRLADDAEEKT